MASGLIFRSAKSLAVPTKMPTEVIADLLQVVGVLFEESNRGEPPLHGFGILELTPDLPKVWISLKLTDGHRRIRVLS
jgi:hypothetical protein